MDYIILLFGLLIALMGTMLVFKPEYVLGLIRVNADTVWLHVVAVVTRLILGTLLIIYSAYSKHPVILEIIGWIAIIAAMVLGGIGRSNFKALIKWVLKFVLPFTRSAGWMTVCFGLFLVYAVL